MNEEAMRREQQLPTLATLNQESREGILRKGDLPPSFNNCPFIEKEQLGPLNMKIGKGSFGTVYKTLYGDKEVAVKKLKARNLCDKAFEEPSTEMELEQKNKLVDLLTREVRVWKHIHVNEIVQFVGICLNPPAIITEFCRHGSLFNCIENARSGGEWKRHLSWERRLRMAFNVAKGMNYLHSGGSRPALHRDLKTPNIVLDEEFNCKICDFNTSKFVDAGVVTNSIYNNNPLWLAPEIIQGEKFSKESDVYPFGIILWELMTWMKPFEGKPIVNVVLITALRGERPQIPPNEQLMGGPCPVYDRYCSLIQQCWHKNRHDRPTYDQIVGILAGMLRDLQPKMAFPQHDRPVRPPAYRAYFTKRPRSRRRKKLWSSWKALFVKPQGRIDRCGCLRGDVEQQLRLTHPELEEIWDENNDVEEQLFTPFADQQPTLLLKADGRMIGRKEELGHAFSPTELDIHQSLHDSTHRNDRRDDHEVNVARERWEKIAKVVRLIAAKPLASRTLEDNEKQKLIDLGIDSKGSIVKPRGTPSNVSRSTILPPSPSSEHSSVEQGHASTEIGEIENAEHAKKRMGSWDKIKGLFSSESLTPLHPFWDLLLQHLKNTARLHQSGAVSDEAVKGEKARTHWSFLRQMFLLDTKKVSENWKNLLSVISPQDEQGHVDADVFANVHNTDQQSSAASSVSREPFEGTSVTKDFSEMEKRHHEEDRTNYRSHDGGSRSMQDDKDTDDEEDLKRKWAVLCKLFSSINLSEEWDEIVSFMSEDTTFTKHKWDAFKKGFLENKSLRSHPAWEVLLPWVAGVSQKE